MVQRRDFLKLIGLGGSGALLDGCSPTPTDTLMPYLVAPDDIVPGVPAYYATTCRECPAGCGLLAKTREGRVIKAEGNPAQPIGAGRLCVRGQASVQSLYNPDRFRGPMIRDGQGELRPIGWDEALKALAARLRDIKAGRRGARVAWIGGLLTGSLERLTREWLTALGSERRLFYEGFDYEPLRRAGEVAFGRREIPRYHVEDARFLLSFGADFLETWLSNVELTRAFGRMRAARASGQANAFVFVGPRLSMTASNADAWLPVPPGAEAALALSIVHATVEQGLAADSVKGDLGWIRSLAAPFAPEATAQTTAVAPDTVREMARSLCQAAPSVAIGGGVSAAGEQSVSLELAVLLVNAVAGNIGRTVTYGAGSALDGLATYRDLLGLVDDMRQGRIEALFLHHANPAYTLPASSGFTAALEKVPFVVSLSSLPDETTSRAHLVLPDHHFLESWGDYTPRAGVLAIQQPAMTPTVDSRGTGDVLIAAARQVDAEMASQFDWPDYHNWIRSYWNFIVRPKVAPEQSWETFWTEMLTRGGRYSTVEPAAVKLRPWAGDLHPQLREPLEGSAEGFALVVYPSAHFFDGRGANNPWLQEIPDPVTKIVWDGWAEMHPDAATRLGVREGDLVELESPYGRLTVTVHLYAGLRPDVVAMPLGQGRAGPLRYAAGRGASPLALLAPTPDAASGSVRWRSVRVGVRSQNRRLPLVVVQSETRAQVEQGRPAFAQLVAPDLVGRRHESAGRHEGPVDFYPPHDHPEHRWGMAIDLNACTGCNACVAACYAENNVPVVGRELCAQGREMSWIRIERYADGAPEPRGVVRPNTVFLPMLCQHCDDAPCESVCPVYATYHNPEGLNAQIYNRCVGTRYCSNNCPYKVRRFNWTTFAWPAPLELPLNPDVTVRSMGVMEKCTFCVQRIQAGKNVAKREGRTLRDGEITSACAQTCPADAIVFGDLHDPQSRVSALARDPRGYHILELLNTRPAVTYLKRIVPATPWSSAP